MKIRARGLQHQMPPLMFTGFEGDPRVKIEAIARAMAYKLKASGLQTQSQRLTNSKPAAYNIKSSGLQHQRPSPIIPRDSRGKKNPRRSRAKSRAPTAHIVKRNSRSRHSDIQIFRHSDIRMMHRRGYRKVSAANYREVECC